MGALKEAAIRPPARRSVIDRLLTELGDEDRTDLADLLHDTTISDQVIVRALATIDQKVGASTIALWRRTNGVR